MVRGWTVKASLLAAAALTVNALLLAPVRPVAVAVRPYSVASPVPRRSQNTATPLTAATVVVPDSVPQAGLPVRASVIPFVAVVTVLPDSSCTATTTAGAIAAPAVTLLGWTVKASMLAVPVDTLKALLVAPASPVAAAVSV